MFSATKGGSTAGYQISRSVRLRSSASAYFNRTPASNGNRQTSTLSFWFKRGALGTSQMVFDCGEVVTPVVTRVSFLSGDTLRIENLNSTRNIDLVTSQVFRDPSAWYHIVVAFDTTQATSSNRVKLYVNGIQVTAFSTNSITIAQNGTLAFNSTSYPFNIGRNVNNAEYTDGYLTEVNFIDGQALTPSSFGETNAVTGVWQPKKYTGTYGTNGFYLNFSDNSSNTATTIGKDYSGNGNNWTPNNISVTAGVTYDSMLDVPTQWADGGNGRGNYCTLNPLNGTGITANFFTDSANLNLNVNNNSAYRNVRATFSPENLKGYFEVTATTAPNFHVGFAYESIAPSSSQYTAAGTFFITDSGEVRNGATSIKTGCTPAFSSGDVLQVAFDFTNGARNVWFGRNGTWGSNSVGVGDPANGTNPVLTVSNIAQAALLYFAVNSGAGTVTIAANFGQRPFAYTPPSGFKALNTLNLPTPTILKGNQYFDATLYTGNGSTLSVTNSGAMQPDLVWLKGRSVGYDHFLYDAVRGPLINLSSNLTSAEQTVASSLTSFNSNGFSLGGGTASINNNGTTYVGWQWKEGATQGFDIVTFTAPASNQSFTVNHNLGVTPSMIIVKRRDSATGGDWWTWHIALGNNTTDYVALNQTAAEVTAANMWGTLGRDSTAFGVNVPTSCVANGTYVAYLFAEVAGFSRFGSYTGNGSTDGPFVFCGFRPRYVMVKRTDSADSWQVWDTARDPYNVTSANLYPNLANAEVTDSSQGIDIVSNGFKLRTSNVRLNASGGTYIFAAFAENPFKNSLAR